MRWNDRKGIEDVYEFTEHVLASPIRINGRRVYNFNIHPLRRQLLEKIVEKTDYEILVIPYNLASVWTRILQLLPPKFMNLPMLYYDKKTYHVVKPYRLGDWIEYRKSGIDLAYRTIGKGMVSLTDVEALLMLEI